ncbi:MAG: heme NO-binding domain-containing protein, partial [Pseudomonadota bacterium]|nr:heme NO-binding domain-containing protein [Pseudomonadota bacterium]
MHGLINKAVQSFFCHTYGAERWDRVVRAADIGVSDFEAMLVYDDDESRKLLGAVCHELARAEAEVLEALGTVLVS